MVSTSFHRVIAFAQFEFSRFLFSKRGLVAIISYLAIWALILTNVVAKGAAFFKNPQFERFITQILGEVGLENLSNWPVPELIVFWLVAVLTFPFFAMFSSADQLCGDKARGTIRFLLLRAKREDLLLGRFLGQVLVVSSFILLALIASNILIVWNDSTQLAAALNLSSGIFIDIVFVVLPMIAFMLLLNVYSTSSKQAIVHCLLLLTLGSIIIGLLADYVWQGLELLSYLLPNANLFNTLSLSASKAEQYLLPVAQTVAYGALTFTLFKKQGV